MTLLIACQLMACRTINVNPCGRASHSLVWQPCKQVVSWLKRVHFAFDQHAQEQRLMNQCPPKSLLQKVSKAKLLATSAPCYICRAPPCPQRLPGLKLSQLTCISISNRSGLPSRLDVESRWGLLRAVSICLTGAWHLHISIEPIEAFAPGRKSHLQGVNHQLSRLPLQRA